MSEARTALRITSRTALRVDAGTLALGASLTGVTIWSWWLVWRQSRSMDSMMMGMSPSLRDAAAFIAAWGVMMTAMMLPSAAPGILLYRTVRRRLAPAGERAIPASIYAATYLAVWTLLGVPVYGGYVASSRLAMCCRSFATFVPYGVASVLIAAGLYQFTRAKLACLAHCESPLSYFMSRWRGGYRATLALATRHSLYCVGCCWALMLVLVAAGAMGIWWVTGIAVIVFTEKLLPNGTRTARATGVLLVASGVAIAIWPASVAAIR